MTTVNKMRSLFVVLGLMAVTTVFSQASIPTKLVIRVKAKDAHLYGPLHTQKYGPVLIAIKDANTGKLYAKGFLGGDTGYQKPPVPPSGDTTGLKPVKKPGRFEATIDIKEPTLVTAEVISPSKKRNATTAAPDGFTYAKGESVITSTQIWLVPGKNIDGDGLLVEVPGFILDIVQPAPNGVVRLDALTGGALNVDVSLSMMCGCKITKGGTWDANNIDVEGFLRKQGDQEGQRAAFSLADTSRYKGAVDIKGKGKYELTVTAYDRVTKETGVDHLFFKVE